MDKNIIEEQQEQEKIENKNESKEVAKDQDQDNKDNLNNENNNPNNNIEKKEYNFCTPQKIGNKPDLMTKFVISPAFRDIVNFLYNIQHKIKGMKKSEVISPSVNECLKEFDNLYNKLEELYIKHPPREGNEKYTDPVFKRFHTDLNDNY